MTVLTLENTLLRAEFHARGAALSRLIYKPLARDVVLRTDDPTAPFHYTNTIVGPLANRVSKGAYSLDNQSIRLDQNEGDNSLHCGKSGLSECDWTPSQTGDRISFTTTDHTATGTQTYRVDYHITGADLHLSIAATSTKTAAFNLAPHTYFTLGAPRADDLMIAVSAETYLPVDAENLPTGQRASVAKTPFDLTQSTPFGTREIDHNYCRHNSPITARLSYDRLQLDLETTAEGLQVYDARHLGRTAIALEPQGWPNAVNTPAFPTPFVAANTAWTTHTVLKLSPIST